MRNVSIFSFLDANRFGSLIVSSMHLFMDVITGGTHFAPLKTKSMVLSWIALILLWRMVKTMLVTNIDAHFVA